MQSGETLRLANLLVANLTLAPSRSERTPSTDVTKGLATTVLKFLAAFEGVSLPDSESGTVDSVRFYLRNHPERFPPGSAVRFDELYQNLTTRLHDAQLRTRLSLLLFSLSRQRVHAANNVDGTRINIAQTVDPQPRPLPVENADLHQMSNGLSSQKQFPTQETATPQTEPPPQGHASRKSASVEGPVTSGACEADLVHDALYICQGIDGRYLKFETSEDGMESVVLNPSLRISGPMQQLVLRLCELGFLFKKVHSFAAASSQQSLPSASDAADSMEISGGGMQSQQRCFTSQAFAYAVSKELAEYYRLMAVLESRATVQKEGQKSADGALTLKRLYIWLSEASRKMRILAVLIESIAHLKGGALASALYAHSRTGDPFGQKFIMRLLRKVSVPLFNMIKSWIFEGEFSDPHQEFFIVDNVSSHITSHGSDLWRNGYTMSQSMLPDFLSPTLAEKILRAGKSINFLRSRCGDVEWVQERAAASEATQAVSYTNLEALHVLIEEASSKVDRRLIQILTKKYSLPIHFKALRRYVLLGQGDFVQSLLDALKPELDKEMSKISEVVVMGCIRTAIHSSNAMYDDEDVLDRLCMKKLGTFTAQLGWDVFALDYRIDPASPLSAVIAPSTVLDYQRVFRLLWKLRKAEGSLNECWKGMKFVSRSTNRSDLGVGKRVRELLLLAFNMRSKLSHFCTNFQYYITFEVLEGAWKDFTAQADKATDLDALIHAHEAYMGSILSKCLMDSGQTAEQLRALLSEYFRLVDGFEKTIVRLVTDTEQILHFLYVRLRGGDAQLSWTAGTARPEIDDVPVEYYHEMRLHFSSAMESYERFISAFTEQVSGEAHIDLRFLMFRLDFEDMCTKQEVDAEAMISEETMQD